MVLKLDYFAISIAIFNASAMVDGILLQQTAFRVLIISIAEIIKRSFFGGYAAILPRL